MRKRSVQEIIEVTTAGGTQITSSVTRQQRIKQTAAAERKIAAERNKDQKAKPSQTQSTINQKEKQLEIQQQNADTRKKKAEAIAKAEAAKQRSSEKETQASKVASREKLRKTIAGGKPNIQKTKGGNKSISDTGTVASNAIKRAASLGRAAAAIPANIAKQKAKAKLGRMQMADRPDGTPGKAPEGGTVRQKIGYAAKKSGERINTAVTNTRRKAGSGIEKFGKKLANEDFIHEAEKDTSKEVEKDSSKEVKKKTIDVMKGKNAVEVNPKIQAEATMSPAQKRKDTNLKKKYDDSDMKQNMIDQYGEEEGMKVYYATIRKQAMKENVSGLEVQNVSDGIKFREYEFIDVIKNEPMKSPKNNITWTEEKKPVKGLVKLGAMVVANEKKRKNALQIQKVIGEDKKMGKQSDEALAAAHKKFSSMDQTSPANSFMTKRVEKEINRRKKANPKPDVTNEGKGSNPNKRYIGDPVVTSKKSFSKTGKIGIDYYTDDEKKKSEKEKIKDAQDPKKNMSREKATQNMQMLKRMTPQEKYARKMRIKQQQKDKK